MNALCLPVDPECTDQVTLLSQPWEAWNRGTRPRVACVTKVNISQKASDDRSILSVVLYAYETVSYPKVRTWNNEYLDLREM